VQKMSKSLGNAIGINEPAAEMYGKLMSINDELMWRYWTFLTDLRQSEIDTMRATVERGDLHPMQAKKNLAHMITAGFHGVEEATAAAENWAAQFQQKGVGAIEDLPEVSVSITSEGLSAPKVDGGGTPPFRIAKLLQLCGLAASTGEATRKLNENAVSINGEKFIGKVLSREAFGETGTIRLGKKTVRIKWTA